MKRKLCVVVSALLLAILALSLVACTKDKDGANDKTNCISRETTAFYAGASEQFAVSVEIGRREKSFVADGKSVDVVDFVQIEIVPLQKNEYEVINYVLSGEGATFAGQLSPSTNGEWTATVELAFAPTSIAIFAGEDECELQLANVLDGCLSSADVLNIAKTNFKERIDKELAEGKGEREIYIKLISGDRKTYYYYVSFIGEGVDYWAVLINPQSGDIVTQK